MSKASARAQSLLIGALFALSLGLLLWHSAQGLLLPGREQALRDRLADCARELAAGASRGDLAPGHDEALGRLTAQVLHSPPRAEGVFYLAGSDRFLGYAPPGDEPEGARGPRRREPPPLEMSTIRL
jgi:hypothetical protein